MLKSKKGYLLTESIIAITVVATIITIVYAIIVKNLIRQNNEITKNNTSYGMYILKEVRKYYLDNEIEFDDDLQNTSRDYLNITSDGPEFLNNINVHRLYFLKYDKIDELILREKIPYSVKKELKEIDSSDQACKYRYLLIFKEKNADAKLFDYSYATLGADCSK